MRQTQMWRGQVPHHVSLENATMHTMKSGDMILSLCWQFEDKVVDFVALNVCVTPDPPFWVMCV